MNWDKKRKDEKFNENQRAGMKPLKNQHLVSRSASIIFQNWKC